MGADFEVGLSAIKAAQSAILVHGNNITNANTKGYSRQDPVIVTKSPTMGSFGLRGQGVRLDRVERKTAEHLNSRLLEKQTAFAKEVVRNERLTDLEGVFNEPSDFGIKNSISSFFDAVQEVSKSPESVSARVLMVERSKAMTNKFNLMSRDIDSMLDNMRTDVMNAVGEVNVLTSRIGDLNGKISTLLVAGLSANDLQDQRDETIRELSDLINIEAKLSGDNATKIVTFLGREIISSGSSKSLDYNITPDGEISVVFEEDGFFAKPGGGELGGLIEFQTFANTSKERVNILAGEMINQINRIHSEGVGSAGSFSVITGINSVSDPNLPLNSANLNSSITAGKLYVTERDDLGPIVKTIVDISATDSLNDIVNRLNSNPGLVNLTASVTDNKLKIEAAPGFRFDFSSSPDPDPPNLGSGKVVVDGNFTGPKNEKFIFTVEGGTGGNDVIGVTPGLKVRVTDSAGSFVRDFNIGVDVNGPANNNAYVPGTTINIGDGLKMSVSAGSVSNGDNFTVDVLKDSDETNILAALGVNTLFSGKDASDIAVASDIQNDPTRIAAASSSSIGDNSNLLRMIGLDSETVVNGRTFKEHVTETVTLVGLEIEENNRTLSAEKGVLDSLAALREQSVGVSIDEELARLLSLEQMFNAAARFISTLDSTLNRLLEL